MKRVELWDKINADEKICDTLFYLRERWQDEKEYEDINDYLEVIKKLVPQATKIYKRPFGVLCACSDGNVKVSVKAKGNALQLCAESVK